VKTLLLVIAAVALVYLAIVAFYAVMQRSLVYYPVTAPIEQAQQMAAAQGGTPWLSEEGQWLGWTIDAGDAEPHERRRRALVMHGNAGMALHRGYYADLLAGFSTSGPWEVHILEYPGYGARDGAPTQASLVAAAVDAVDRMMAEAPGPLLVIGESLGSGVASALVRERPEAIAALLLVAPFDSMVNLARHHMRWLPAGLLLRDRYDNLDALRAYSNPLVVVTAGKDDIVPAERATPLLNQHRGPALHETQNAAGHNTLQFEPTMAPWPAIDAFLAAESE
jgi:fermentation-respiration switch protein FrsA (DUF1100 family)